MTMLRHFQDRALNCRHPFQPEKKDKNLSYSGVFRDVESCLLLRLKNPLILYQ